MHASHTDTARTFILHVCCCECVQLFDVWTFVDVTRLHAYCNRLHTCMNCNALLHIFAAYCQAALFCCAYRACVFALIDLSVAGVDELMQLGLFALLLFT